MDWFHCVRGLENEQLRQHKERKEEGEGGGGKVGFIENTAMPHRDKSLSLSLSVSLAGQRGPPPYTVNGWPYPQVLGFPLE